MIRKNREKGKYKCSKSFNIGSLVYHSTPFGGAAMKLQNILLPAGNSAPDPSSLQPGEFFPADGGDAREMQPSGNYFPADGGTNPDFFPPDGGDVGTTFPGNAGKPSAKKYNILDIIEGLATGAAAAKGAADLMNGENVQQSLDAIRGIFRRGRIGTRPIDPLDYEEGNYFERPVRPRMPDPLDYEEGARVGARSSFMNALRRMGGEGIRVATALRSGAITAEELII